MKNINKRGLIHLLPLLVVGVVIIAIGASVFYFSQTLKQRCISFNGTWVERNNTCADVNRIQCVLLGGTHKKYNSACNNLICVEGSEVCIFGTNINNIPSNNQNAEAETDNSTAKWKTYKSDAYGFVLKYPPEHVQRYLKGTEYNDFVFEIIFDKHHAKDRISINVFNSSNFDQLVSLRETRLVGHVTDTIDSKKQINDTRFSGVILNYQIYFDNKSYNNSEAIITDGRVYVAITSPSEYFDQILSTFEFTK